MTRRALGRGARRDACARRACARSTARCRATRPPPPSSSWPAASCRAAPSTSPGSTAARPASATSTVLQRMGADVTLDPRRSPAPSTIRASPGPLQATVVQAAEIPSLDEIPALAVAAAVADGHHRLQRRGRVARQGGRPPRSRWPTWSRPSAPGPRSTATPSSITGVGRARSAAPASTAGATTAWPWPPRWRPGGAPRAHTAVITGFDAVETSYPGFADDLRRWRRAPARPPRRAAGRHRRPGRRGQVHRVARRGRHTWGSSDSTPAPCTGPSPPRAGARRRARRRDGGGRAGRRRRPSRWGSA